MTDTSHGWRGWAETTQHERDRTRWADFKDPDAWVPLVVLLLVITGLGVAAYLLFRAPVTGALASCASRPDGPTATVNLHNRDDHKAWVVVRVTFDVDGDHLTHVRHDAVVSPGQNYSMTFQRLWAKIPHTSAEQPAIVAGHLSCHVHIHNEEGD